MDSGIAGERALVIASSRGLGLAAARAKAPRSVCLGAIRRAWQTRSFRSPPKAGEAGFVTADLTQFDSISALNAAVDQKLGGVDILVNNVGGPPAKPAGRLE